MTRYVLPSNSNLARPYSMYLFLPALTSSFGAAAKCFILEAISRADETEAISLAVEIACV